MNLTYWSMKRPLTIVMIFLAVILLGVDGYLHLPVRRFPQVSIPVAQVVVNDPGTSPSGVMNTVSNPLENQLATISGLYTIKATSLAGQSRILVQFDQGTSLNADMAQVNAAIQRMAKSLPTGASYPAVIEANPSSLPILNVAVLGSPAAPLPSSWVQNTLIPRLEEVPGVGQVQSFGESTPTVNVDLNSTLLQSLHLPVIRVGQQVAAANVSQSNGYLTSGSRSYQVSTQAQFTSLSALKNLTIMVPSMSKHTQPTAMPLHDLASVMTGNIPPVSEASYNGHPALGLSITEQPGANTLNVTHALLTTLHGMAATFPPGVSVKTTSNSANFTQSALDSTQIDLFLAVFFAGIILFAFLHRWRHTLIILIAIPVSIIATMGVMWVLGFSLDLISLMALSLLIGFLVDDAVVVLENIHRHQSLGKTPWNAAFDGRMEIGAAAVAITLTDVVVYLPLALVSGNVGAMFREFGLTIVSATLFSLLVSFTLTPLLAARWGNHSAEPRWAAQLDQAFNSVRNVYAKTLHALLHHRWIAVLTVIATIGITASYFPLGLIHTTFIPPENTGLFTMNLTLPPGTPLNTTQGDIKKLSQNIRRISGVDSVFATAGSSVASNVGQLSVQLTGSGRESVITRIENQSDQYAANIPNLTATTVTANPLTPGIGQPIAVRVLGPKLSTVQNLASAVAKKMAGLRSLKQVINDSPVAFPQLGVRISHQAAQKLGVSVQDVVKTIQTETQGLAISTYQPRAGSTPSNILLQTQGSNLGNLLSAPVPSTAEGAVSVSTVAHLVPSFTATAIQQQNRLYADTISAGLSQPGTLGSATQSIKAAINNIPMPSGYEVVYGGQVHQQKTAFEPLFKALGLSILLVYMLMAALYESLVLPLAIMVSVPLSALGAVTALAFTGQTINIFSIVGLIMLMGIVTKNAILLVDYTQTLRKRGQDRESALIEAGRTRLRPILMTSLTMIMAMIPLAVGIGSGAQDHQAMAIAVIGGLLSSTVLTLGIIPVAYTFLDDWLPWTINEKIPMQMSAPKANRREQA